MVSVLLNESSVSPVPAGDTSFAGNEGALDVLANLGRTVAIGVEAGEDIDEVSTSTVKLQVRWQQYLMSNTWRRLKILVKRTIVKYAQTADASVQRTPLPCN